VLGFRFSNTPLLQYSIGMLSSKESRRAPPSREQTKVRFFGPGFFTYPDAAMVSPAAVRARVREPQVISPSRMESADAMAILAERVNSV